MFSKKNGKSFCCRYSIVLSATKISLTQVNVPFWTPEHLTHGAPLYTDNSNMVFQHFHLKKFELQLSWLNIILIFEWMVIK